MCIFFAPPHGLAFLGIFKTFKQMASLKVSLMGDMNELYDDLKVITNKTFSLSSVVFVEPVAFW